VGCVVTPPISWLLSFAAALPFFLGVFFFALFGLVIGAVTFRVAMSCRPYARAAILSGTTAVVLLGWGLSIVKEASDFPADMSMAAADRTRDIGERSREEYQALIAGGIREWLRRTYPPGGTLGYVRWSLMSGRIEKGSVPELSRTLTRSPSGWVWALRVVLSIGLFAFGVGSQTLPLRYAGVKHGRL